jgi:uncharacterized protein (PEP-CTERM system associated)
LSLDNEKQGGAPHANAHRRRLSVAALALTVAAASGTVRAEKWTFDGVLDARLTSTDNATLVSKGQEQSDVIGQFSPRLSFRGEGARLFLTGNVDLSYLSYAEQTQPDRFAPSGTILARTEAIERLFFIEGSVSALQAAVDPFGPPADSTSSLNTGTVAQYRLSPYVAGGRPDGLHYTIRSDNTWTQTTGPLPRDAQAYAARHFADITREARPFGYFLHAERETTEFEDELQPRRTQESVRVGLRHAVWESLVVGVRGGRERNNFLTSENDGSIAGVDFSWRPTERTDVDGFLEHRFFGPAWQLSFRHRSPRIALGLQLGRTLTTSPFELFTLPAGGDVSALLDAALTTRYPDPAERLGAVRDLIARFGLPATLGTPFTVLSEQVNLANMRTASIALIGNRNTLAGSVYSVRNEAFERGDVLTNLSPATNNRQSGGGLVLSHRFSENINLNAGAHWSRVHALDPSVTRDLNLRSLQLQVDRRFTAKTSAYVGARQDILNADSDDERVETRAFVGIGHRL